MENQNQISAENVQAQMRKGTLEFLILLIISSGKVYSSDILNRLKEADLIVVEGTIYPLLSRLKNSGLLSYDWEESPSGPPRKYYSLTEKGAQTLEQLKLAWKAMDKSINALIRKFK
jgi:PadR family transcriptional regulator PadR